jgi:hypothetical protein
MNVQRQREKLNGIDRQRNHKSSHQYDTYSLVFILVKSNTTDALELIKDTAINTHTDTPWNRFQINGQ